jgi:hypothetical protein
MKLSKSLTPPWLLLLVGVGIGRSWKSLESIDSLISSWLSFVNMLLVPLYALCILLYLGSLGVIEARRLLQPRKVVPVVVQEAVLPPIPEADEEGHVNMSGSYKLISNDNFEGFLELQGVPWALRRAANQARPIHKITHIGKTVTIQIKGIIESQTTYQIDGPAVETSIRGRVFKDQMKYLDSGDGIIVSKTALEEDYDVTVERRLSSNRKTITMTSRALFKDGREPVQAVQIFERIE